MRIGWVECRIWEHVEVARCFRCLGYGILVCSPDLNIKDFLKTDAGFVWVEMAGVRVYSCYFPPNDPFEVFET